jgi:hypothetical protein
MEQHISKQVAVAFDEIEFDGIVIQEETPSQDTLCLQVLERIVLVVSKGMNIRATI